MPKVRDLYFAFPDGSLAYECDGCLQSCCRIGGAIQTHMEREGADLFRLYPFAASLVRERSGPVVILQLPAGGCVWFTDDGLCSIHRDHGRDLKPFTCRLYPFNRLVRTGSTLIVSPRFGCPLSLDRSCSAAQSSHQALAGEVQQLGLLGVDVPRDVVAALPSRRGFRVGEFLERERAFTARCSEEIGRGRFIDVLSTFSVDPERLAGRVDQARHVLGLEPEPSARDTMDDVLMAIAGSLRLDFPYMSGERLLAVLAVGSLLVRAASPGGDFTPQSAASVFGRAEPVSMLLGADPPLNLPSSVVRNLPFAGDPRGTVAAFRLLRGLADPQPNARLFVQVLEAYPESVDRIAFMTRISAHIGSGLRIG